MVSETRDDAGPESSPVGRTWRPWLSPPRPRGTDDAPADDPTVEPAAARPAPRPATSRLSPLPLAVVPDIPAAEPAAGERRSLPAHLWHSTQRHASAFRRYFSIRTNDLAAIIAFNGLIAVVPMFLLVVAIAGVLLRDDELFRDFRKTVISIFPSQNARDALNDASASRQNVGWFGLLSLIGFTWIGSSFVATVTRTINNLYDVRGSPFVRSRIRAVVVIVGFSILLMIVVLAGTLPTLFINAEVPRIFADVKSLFLFQAIGQIVSYALSLVFAFLLFLIAYRYLPAVRQRWRDVVPGALVASLGLVLLTQVFPIYVRIYQSLPSSSSIGAAFVFVSILVTWSYLLAHVLLIGAWLNARADERRRLKQALTITHLEASGRAGDVPIQRAPLSEPPPLPIASQRAPLSEPPPLPIRE
jgi:membrane protein